MKRSIRVSFCVYFRTIKLIVPYLAMFAASFFTLFSLYGSQSSPISFLFQAVLNLIFWALYILLSRPMNLPLKFGA